MFDVRDAFEGGEVWKETCAGGGWGGEGEEEEEEESGGGCEWGWGWGEWGWDTGALIKHCGNGKMESRKVRIYTLSIRFE